MNKQTRLFSLDVLRGLDMILLTIAGPIFWSVNKIWSQPEWLRLQFSHAWGGFTLWDFIMPLFIFICGAAVPYALAKRTNETGGVKASYFVHVLFRVAFLWLCGMLVQGGLATLDPLKMSPFNNTLQAIAIGYLVASLTAVIPVRAVRIAIPIVLAVAYGVMIHVMGDYSPAGNYAAAVEEEILDEILPDENRFMAAIENPKVALPYGGYTWFLTSMMFGFMALCGAQCAEILRGKSKEKFKVLILLATGASLLAAGWGLSLCGIPMIKHIYTVSFTCMAMGVSVLALTALYCLTDVLNLRRGWGLVLLFGECALTAYMASTFFRPVLESATKVVTQGLPQVVDGKYMPLVATVCNVAIVVFVCEIRRRLRRSRSELPAEEGNAAEPAAAIAQSAPPPPPPPQQVAVPRQDSSSSPNRSLKTNLKLHGD